VSAPTCVSCAEPLNAHHPRCAVVRERGSEATCLHRAIVETYPPTCRDCGVTLPPTRSQAAAASECDEPAEDTVESLAAEVCAVACTECLSVFAKSDGVESELRRDCEKSARGAYFEEWSLMDCLPRPLAARVDAFIRRAAEEPASIVVVSSPRPEVEPPVTTFRSEHGSVCLDEDGVRGLVCDVLGHAMGAEAPRETVARLARERDAWVARAERAEAKAENQRAELANWNARLTEQRAQYIENGAHAKYVGHLGDVIHRERVRAEAAEQVAESALREGLAECTRLRAERDEARGSALLAIARADEYATRAEAAVSRAESCVARVHAAVDAAILAERERIVAMVRERADAARSRERQTNSYYAAGAADALAAIADAIAAADGAERGGRGEGAE
jgi:hypothetical protein